MDARLMLIKVRAAIAAAAAAQRDTRTSQIPEPVVAGREIKSASEESSSSFEISSDIVPEKEKKKNEPRIRTSLARRDLSTVSVRIRGRILLGSIPVSSRNLSALFPRFYFNDLRSVVDRRVVRILPSFDDDDDDRKCRVIASWPRSPRSAR